ncbi:DNA primase [uncultured Alistipes sp.]|uniref:DNA primase n=1 Tax=uncultured Alistipes sp. TaxID=538949 RepID=UPI002617B959|nr:DNA primase [uncultured Alistipes sp.]
MIDRATVDRIYAAANIVEVIGDYVTLKRKGVNYQACCPFHNEKTPSFVVSPAKGVFKCFGCGKAGNAVTFVMEHEGISYPEALKIVAKRYGIEVKERELTEEEIRRNDDRESMFALNGWACDYFADYLKHSQEGVRVGMSYFRQKRGFTDATIEKFGLGYCSAEGDRMTQAALAAGYREEFLLSTGLSIRRERDNRLFDRFYDRVMFPVHNISGRIVAFGGRILGTNKHVGKYQNSPESEIYSKKRELYGLYFAKKAIQQQDYAILVEGYTDVISMHQAGVENVVSSSGTSLTTEQIRLLNRFTKNITVIYDGDAAGIHASIRGIDMILAEGMNVRIVLLPEPEDPDSFARAHSAAEVQEYIKANEVDFITFKAQLLMKESQNDPIKRASLIGDMVQSITQIPDPIQRSVYIKECARLMDIDERVLVEEVARKRVVQTGGGREAADFVRRQQLQLRREADADGHAPAEAQVDFSKGISAGSATEELERELLKYLLKYGHCNFGFKEGGKVIPMNVADVILSNLEAQELHFQNPTYQKLLDIYRRQRSELGEGAEVPAHLFINHSDPEVCNAAVDLLTWDDNYVPSKIWEQREIHVESVEEILANGVPKAVILYKSNAIKKLIEEQTKRLAAEDLTDDEETEIMSVIATLNRELVSISHKVQRTIL